jgi:hypothetical protein
MAATTAVEVAATTVVGADTETTTAVVPRLIAIATVPGPLTTTVPDLTTATVMTAPVQALLPAAVVVVVGTTVIAAALLRAPRAAARAAETVTAEEAVPIIVLDLRLRLMVVVEVEAAAATVALTGGDTMISLLPATIAIRAAVEPLAADTAAAAGATALVEQEAEARHPCPLPTPLATTILRAATETVVTAPTAGEVSAWDVALRIITVTALTVGGGIRFSIPYFCWLVFSYARFHS